MEQLGSHWTDFHEIRYLIIFRKYGENSSFVKNQAGITDTLRED
jgi:hypothetical protein